MARVGNVPTVSAYKGNVGQQLMHVGNTLDDISQKYEKKQQQELAQAKKLYTQGLNINLYNSINELRNDPNLSANPQGLASAMDEVLNKTLQDVDDNDVKMNVMVDYQLKKNTYVNHAQAEFDRVQRAKAKSYAYDSVYANIDSLGTSFANTLTGNYTDDDVANFQHSLANIQGNIDAKNPDGTYIFTDTQRRAMKKDAQQSFLNGFKAIYEQLDDEEKRRIGAKLDADYYNIPIGNNDFEYKGNINLASRPICKNTDGSVSSERSMSFNEDGQEIIIPTIRTENGKRVDMTPQEAIEWYHKTGEHLGKYGSVEEADQAAERIHNRGEGIPLVDIIGEDSYKDIKRYTVEQRKKDVKARLEERKLLGDEALADFYDNPTEEGLDKILEYKELSQNKIDRLRGVLEASPNYQAETTYDGVKDATKALTEFMKNRYASDEEENTAFLDMMEKMNRTQQKGIVTPEEHNVFVSQATNSLRDKNLKKVFQDSVSSIEETMAWNTKQLSWMETRQYTSEHGYQPSRLFEGRGAVKEMMRDGLQAELGYLAMGDKESAEKVRKETKKQILEYIYPTIKGKSVGDTIVVNGKVYKITSLDDNVALESR